MPLRCAGLIFCLCCSAGLRAVEAATDSKPATPADAQAASDTETDPDIALALRLESAFQKLARRVAPGVVSLQVVMRLKNRPDLSDYLGSGAPERDFEGSGVIVDAAGWIVTNEHVIRGADAINVKFSDGRVCKAKITGIDPRSDLAMLKLDDPNAPATLPSVKFADSDKVQVGQYAMAVGNPFGLSNSFTMGVVSARGRNMPLHSSTNDVFYGNLIQTDTPINPGNSGGPLFNLHGELIGINTMIYSSTGYSQGCSFAIPSNHLKPRLAYLKLNREIEYGWLGVALKDLKPLQNDFKVPDNKGVIIDNVIDNTPADRAGLAHGMVVLDFDGTRVGSVQELIGVVNETPVGRSVKVKVLDTSGRVADYSVRIAKRYTDVAQSRRMDSRHDAQSEALEEAEFAQETAAGSIPAKVESSDPLEKLNAKLAAKSTIWRGMMLKELSAEEGAKRGGRIEVVRVRKGSPADRAGLYEGAILAELKHGGDAALHKLASLDEFKRLTEKIKGSAAIYSPLDGFVTIDEK